MTAQTQVQRNRSYRQRRAEKMARMEAALIGQIEWLEGIASTDWDEIVADGGVTAAMVIQQQARTVFLPRARQALNPGKEMRE